MWDAVVAPANPVVVVTTSGDGLWYALLGLAGVLVGAVISGGFNLWVARRKERADAAAESERHGVDLRRAARLIDDDLHAAASAARWSVEHEVFPGQHLTTLGWQRYRDILAPELSDIDWRSVNVAVNAIDAFQSLRGGYTKLHHAEVRADPKTAAMAAAGGTLGLDVFLPTPVPDAAVAPLKDVLWGLDNGRTALAPLMEEKPAGG
jgi:hypothetical protein